MYDSRYEEIEKDDFIENEMQRTKETALKKLSSVADFKTEVSKRSFILMFVYSWQESLPAADRLAEELDFCNLDFLALIDDFEEFKYYYLKTDRKEYYE